MKHDRFSKEDLRRIEAHGLTGQEVGRQLGLFMNPPPHLRLLRPCTQGDGIRVIAPERMKGLIEICEKGARGGRCLKFVPASGAASRMFKTLLKFLNLDREILRQRIEEEARAGQKDAAELLKFMDGLERFAFLQDLKAVMAKRDSDADSLVRRGEFTQVIRSLLDPSGLNYAGLPKGLLKFHSYPSGSRTAFEEHLVEAAFYAASADGLCRIHMTVSPEHKEEFETLLERERASYEDRYGVRFDVTFSVQKKSTDTVAVNMDDTPFRQENGSMLFRPGGHGALIENLNDLGGDVIFIKNIDNVVPDQLKAETYRWKKIIGGCLLEVQTRAHEYLRRISSGAGDRAIVDQALAFAEDDLSLKAPFDGDSASYEKKRRFIREQLDRPIRVCGMVRNEGEPGGGPFWVQEDSGGSSLQIVETAQIDADSQEQQEILKASTHFNPVDLVCGVRDWQGKPFDLRGFVDPSAVFISKKSKGGRDLKALEHPGLWNGAMARWITLFVEVPMITFNPVKTVNDLLRKEHQPG